MDRGWRLVGMKVPRLNVRGEVSWVLRDVKTGRSVDGFGSNELLPAGLAEISSFLFGRAVQWSRLFILDDQDQAIGPSLSFPVNYSDGPPFHIELIATSAAGRNTGVIFYFNLGWSFEAPLARFVPSQPINKTDNLELTIKWKIYVDFQERVGHKVILGGQRDGVTDVNVHWYMPDSYVKDLLFTGQGSSATPLREALVRTKFGTDSSPSDLENDPVGVKGALLDQVVSSSANGVWEVILGTDVSNGLIGEAVVESLGPGRPICRITFNPPLDKTPDYELVFSLLWGDAVEVPPPS